MVLISIWAMPVMRDAHRQGGTMLWSGDRQTTLHAAFKTLKVGGMSSVVALAPLLQKLWVSPHPTNGTPPAKILPHQRQTTFASMVHTSTAEDPAW
jgi:hypothetical protein